MKTNLKENIWIEGFDTVQKAHDRYVELVKLPNGTIYAGETNKITEDLVKSIVNKNKFYINYSLNKEIKKEDWRDPYMFISATESIKSACSNKYCIIYRS